MKPHASIIHEANKKIIIEGDSSAIAQHFSSDYIANVAGEKVDGGHSLVTSFLTLYNKAFPHRSAKIEILVESNDRVAWLRTIRANQEGPFKGFPASNQEITWREMIVSKFSDGLITEEWITSDLAEQLLNSRKRK